MPCRTVSNKEEVYNLPTEFESIHKLKIISFKKVATMPCGRMEKITGTICNIPVDNIDVINMLPKTADTNELFIVL